MVLLRCLIGWLSKNKMNHTSRYGINLKANQTCLVELNSPGITRPIVTFARRVSCCDPEVVPSKNLVHLLQRQTRLFIAQVSMTVKPANLNPGAVRIPPTERLLVVSTSHLGMLPAIIARLRNIYNREKTGRKSKYCLPISSE